MARAVNVTDRATVCEQQLLMRDMMILRAMQLLEMTRRAPYRAGLRSFSRAAPYEAADC